MSVDKNNSCNCELGGIKAVSLHSIDEMIDITKPLKNPTIIDSEYKEQVLELTLESSDTMYNKGTHPNQWFLEQMFGKPKK